VGFLRSKQRLPGTGRALVIKADALTLDTGYTVGKGPSVHSKIRVWVTPDDGGSSFESDASAWGGDEEHLVRGHSTYVRYDPGQRDSCNIDRDRLATEFCLRVASNSRAVCSASVTTRRPSHRAVALAPYPRSAGEAG
jgi:hypothetical protein